MKHRTPDIKREKSKKIDVEYKDKILTKNQKHIRLDESQDSKNKPLDYCH